MNRTLLRAALICVCAFMLFTACSGESGIVQVESPNPIAMEKEPEPVIEEQPAAPAPYRYPFTGLPAELQPTNRPFVVMVENSPAARPQSGLHKADIVYEILAEGDITRFVAVYQSQSADKIGPVRSIRPYFVELGTGLDAVIVHAGWSQDAMNVIVSRKAAHLDQVYGDHKYYWREKSRKAPHNLYTSTELIKEGAQDKKFRVDWTDPVLHFAESKEEVSVQGLAVQTVTIPYINGYTVSYDYDAASQSYRRSMAGKPHTDGETGEQIAAVNILIAEAGHKILDSAGRRDVDVFGPGPALLLQGGKMREVTWENKLGAIRAVADGAEVPLLPGQTWVHVVPSLSKVLGSTDQSE